MFFDDKITEIFYMCEKFSKDLTKKRFNVQIAVFH